MTIQELVKDQFSDLKVEFVGAPSSTYGYDIGHINDKIGVRVCSWLSSEGTYWKHKTHSFIELRSTEDTMRQMCVLLHEYGHWMTLRYLPYSEEIPEHQILVDEAEADEWAINYLIEHNKLDYLNLYIFLCMDRVSKEVNNILIERGVIDKAYLMLASLAA